MKDYNFKFEVWKDKDKKEGFVTNFDKNFIQKDLYYRIPSTDMDGLKIYFKILKNPNIIQLQSICKVFSGELDMTLHKKFFSEIKSKKYSLPILKGANIQSYYVTNETSQGKKEFLNSNAFLKDNKSSRSSSFQFDRIAMQGITGVNEKYRIKSCLVKKNNFLANSTNFILKTSDDFSNYEIITYLNSNLLNWFFKIFSTNSNVNTYEVNILPIIKFSTKNKDKIKNTFNKLDINKLSNFSNILNDIVYETFELDNKDIEYINSYF